MAKQRLKKMVITVTPQTAYHLRDMAAMCKSKSVGRNGGCWVCSV